MPAYVIYQGEVTDPVRHEECKERAAASMAATVARYHGDEYAEARTLREGAAIACMDAVAGYTD
jgi:hypothetical protein